MITLDGKPLLLEDPGLNLKAWMDAYHELADLRVSGRLPVAVESSRTGTRAGTRSGVGLPVPNYSDSRRLKINTLYWPTGASRWGHGLYLADEETAKAMPVNSRVRLEIGDPDHSTLFVDVWVLTPRPISSFDSDDEKENLWLIPVVDDRYWWQYYDIGDLEVEGATTWADLYDTLEGIIGRTIDVDTINPEYLHPDPAELTRRYDNAAVLLDAIAHSIGHRIVFRFDGGTFELLSQNAEGATAQNIANTAAPYQLLAGGGFGASAHIPSRVVVTFPKWSYGVPWCDGDLHKVTKLPGVGTDARGDDTIKVVHSAAYADFTETEAVPNNQAALESIAAAVSADFYAWLGDNYDRTYLGIQSWKLTGFDDCIEWAFGEQMADGKYRAQTRVVSQPHNFGTEQQLTQHFNWVVLDHFQIGVLDGDLVPKDQNGDGYATVSIWDTTAGDEVDTLFDVRAYEWLGTPWKAGTKVWLRWHCEENAWYVFGPAQVGTVLFVLTEDRSRETDGAGNYFGRADAIVQDTVGDVPVEIGDTIEVTFGGRRWLGAVKGCEGIADYYNDVENGDTWIVKECQELTAGFWFTLKEDRTEGQANEDIEVKTVIKNIGHANADYPVELWKSPPPTTPPQCSGVSGWGWDADIQDWVLVFDTCSPGCAAVKPSPYTGGSTWRISGCSGDGQPPPSPQDPLKVRFIGETFPYAFEDAVGYAVLDVDINNVTSNSTMRYHVVQCDQGALINEVEHAEFCPGDSPKRITHEPATFYPFGMKWPDELIENVHDRMALASKNGGTGWTAYSHTLKKHVLLNTEHEEYEFLQDIPQGSCIPKKLKIQALTCRKPEDSTGFAVDDFITEVALAYETTDAGGSGSGQECSDPKLKLNYKTRQALYCGNESSLQTSQIQLSQLLVTTDVYDDGECIIHEQTHVIVFGSCDTISENVVCTTDEQCDESGSGS